ncbi:MAG: hypothetical protein KIT09_31830 [Bryobacteraceae bacterium]|nr:hypothetical protein [Bryobacteraceae bacterium]
MTGTPSSIADLQPSERRFLAAMQRMPHCRFEFLRIAHGELVLDPWPTTILDVKFGARAQATPETESPDTNLKRQVAEFFAYLRSIDSGEIRSLVVQGGLPFHMQIEVAGGAEGAPQCLK